MSTKNSQLPLQIELGGRVVTALGEVALLQTPKLALICSQKCPGDVILKTYDFARFVQSSGLTVTGGFHSAIEKDCLPILIRNMVPTLIVQGHRLSTSRLQSSWKEAIRARRLVLVSPFHQSLKRVTTAIARERNRFVTRLADRVLIPYASPGGVTEALGLELLASGKPVYTFNDRPNVLSDRGAMLVQPELFASNAAGSGAS
jgi:predicted Rossmann fold nucleotide-binding protein DprA/Smf involved in DNA uptake